ncbi:MAG: hypothetical protein ACPG1C_03455 [Alphaproteobacteria bacterium]
MMAFDPFTAIQYGAQLAQEEEPNAPIHDTVIWTAKDGFSFDTDDATPAPDRNLVDFEKLVSAGQQDSSTLFHDGVDLQDEQPSTDVADNSAETSPFPLAEGETRTFLDLRAGSKILARRADLSQTWPSIEQAIHAAAQEIRQIAKSHYSNYEAIRAANLMLPEAGVRIVETSKGRFTYAEIFIGSVTGGHNPNAGIDDSGEVGFDRFKDDNLRFAARLHFHWVNVRPSEHDDALAKQVARRVILAKAKAFPDEDPADLSYEAWVASFTAIYQYYKKTGAELEREGVDLYAR